MNLIDPFQFRDMFANSSSFAVVGNAPTILEHENGKKIDGHDVVVRFNRATVDGVESKIGSRTDILVTNASNSRDLAPPPSETTSPTCIVCFVSPEGIPKLLRAPFAEWVGEVPILLTFGPDLVDLPGLHHTRPMTSGTYLLLTLLRLFTVESLFVTGFTMFGAKGGTSSKYYRDDRPGVGIHHDLDVESIIVSSLLNQCSGSLETTPEVAKLIGEDICSDEAKTRLPKRHFLKAVAARFSWRLIQLGTRLRRFSESK